MRKLLGYILVLIFTALLPACGDTQPQSSAGSTIKAVIKTSTQAASLNVAAIDLTITVPAGVSPPLLADGTVDAANTVTIISSAASDQLLQGATFTPATATAPGQLAIFGIIASGFTTSDEIIINLNIASGTFPTASDFNLLSFDAYDINGAPVTGLTPTLTTTIQ